MYLYGWLFGFWFHFDKDLIWVRWKKNQHLHIFIVLTWGIRSYAKYQNVYPHVSNSYETWTLAMIFDIQRLRSKVT